MTVQLPDADRAAIQREFHHRGADTLGTPMSDAQRPADRQPAVRNQRHRKQP
jgi:hypothetical protein